ncbi:hypothetical protein M2161_007140 [Streptomyces sp. SAI-133]|uniref:hypothetical protein n=1 Tax=Streptomyces sp. SAI-133 TaxID=2940547 RepID=UPI0024738090|nr:hypothetical protein [Streptomyces sp. SAI-133]MDH6588034.1 hypothetical protein [Streptomyces sp. SAI-133]
MAAASTRAVARQPISSPMRVVPGLPTIAARVEPPNTAAVAVPTRCRGTSVAAAGAISDQSTPCVRAAATRLTTIIAKLVANPASTSATTRTRRETTRAVPRETREASATVGTVTTAATRA